MRLRRKPQNQAGRAQVPDLNGRPRLAQELILNGGHHLLRINAPDVLFHHAVAVEFRGQSRDGVFHH